jgi:protein phosphatase
VGVSDTIALDILKGKCNSGDLFLLCSDGLTDLVAESAISATLSVDAVLGDKSAALIQLAKLAGGKDNVTVVLSAIG